MKKILKITFLLISILLLASCSRRTCANGYHELKCVAISPEEHVYKCVRVGCDYEELPMPHCFEGTSACLDCGIDNETVTLEFTLAEDGKSYIVSGIGSCELKHINIPSTYLGLPVTEIADEAFWSRNSDCYEFESFTIPEGVLRIGASAFRDNSTLKAVKLPQSLTHLGVKAFSETSIESIVIPGGIQNDLQSSFSCCPKLSSVVIESGITTLNGTFLECTSLKNITLPDSLQCLNGAFALCNIKHFDIPDSVQILDGAFWGSEIESIKFGSGVKEIINEAFAGTKIKSITIPKSVEVIGASAFADCSELREVIIENGTKRIEPEAFANCPALTKLVIPESIECVDLDAFKNCPNLQYNVYEGMKYLGNEEKPYLVLCGTAGGTRLIAHPDTKIFTENALYNNEDITEIQIGENVTYIPLMALRGMDGVISATVSENNKTFYSVGNCIISRAEKSLVKAFNCSEIPSDGSVTFVDTSVFSMLNMLEAIYIPRGVSSVYIDFRVCSSLSCLIIEGNVTDILVYVISAQEDFAVYYCHDINAFEGVTITYKRTPDGKLPPNKLWNECNKYIYSETEPTAEGSFWHWVDGVPTPWN